MRHPGRNPLLTLAILLSFGSLLSVSCFVLAFIYDPILGLLLLSGSLSPILVTLVVWMFVVEDKRRRRK